MSTSKNITIQIPGTAALVQNGMVSPSLYVLAILFFFFTFCELSCSKQPIASLTGFELVTGSEINPFAESGMIGELSKLSKELKEEKGEEERDIDSDAPALPNIKEGSQNIPANPYAIAALIAALVGLLFSFLKVKNATIFSGYAGVLGAIALFVMQITLSNEVKKAGNGMAIITVNFALAYWSALFCLLGGGILNILRGRAQNEDAMEVPPVVEFMSRPTAEEDNGGV
jgi:hypothetical protein